MADVNDRGQLILIMGLLLAVAFVALALLLNTVIFTENLASRGTDLGGRDAIEFQRTIVTGIGELVDEENDREFATNASVRANVSDGVDELGRVLRLRRADEATVADLPSLTMHNGAVIRQTDPARNLTAQNGDADWFPAREISDTRRFTVNVSGGLNSTTDPDDGFKIVLDESAGTDEWRVSVYQNSTSTQTELAVMNGTEATWTKDVCSPSATPVIDLTAGTVDGSPCSAIEFGKGISAPYDITFDDSDLAEGTYNLTVNVSGPGYVEDFYLNGPGPASSPYFVRAVYSVSVEIYYETRDVAYRSTVRVARGEPA